jgi:hypothetical protein
MNIGNNFLNRLSTFFSSPSKKGYEKIGDQKIGEAKYTYDADKSQIIRNNPDGTKSAFSVKVKVPGDEMVGIGSEKAKLRFKNIESVIKATIEILEELELQNLDPLSYAPGKITVKNRMTQQEETLEVKENPKLSKKTMNLANTLGLSDQEAKAQNKRATLYKMGIFGKSETNIRSDEEYLKGVQSLSRTSENKQNSISTEKKTPTTEEQNTPPIEERAKAATSNQTEVKSKTPPIPEGAKAGNVSIPEGEPNPPPTTEAKKTEEVVWDEKKRNKASLERKMLIGEFKSTEQVFTQNLRNFVDILKEKRDSLKDPTKAFCDKIISLYENILKSSEPFYDEIKDDKIKDDETLSQMPFFDEVKEPLFDAFNKAAPEIAETFSQVINQFDILLKETDTLKNDKEFEKLSQDFQKDPRAKGLSIGSFLIMPVQRFPRYGMLTEGILKNTPPDDDSYNKVKKSVDAAKAASRQLNEHKRKSDKEQRSEINNKLNPLMNEWRKNKGQIQRLLSENILYKFILKKNKDISDLTRNYDELKSQDDSVLKTFFLFIDKKDAKLIAKALKDPEIPQERREKLEAIKQGVIALRGVKSQKARILNG